MFSVHDKTCQISGQWVWLSAMRLEMVIMKLSCTVEMLYKIHLFDSFNKHVKLVPVTQFYVKIKHLVKGIHNVPPSPT